MVHLGAAHPEVLHQLGGWSPQEQVYITWPRLKNGPQQACRCMPFNLDLDPDPAFRFDGSGDQTPETKKKYVLSQKLMSNVWHNFFVTNQKTLTNNLFYNLFIT